MAVLVPMAAGAQVKEPYAVLSNGNSVLTFYYDDQKAERNGMDVGPFTSSYDYEKWTDIISSGWDAQRGSITSVVFDASFANCTSLTSTAYWFFGFEKLSQITGISNLKTDNVTDMSSMFEGCSGLTSLDVTGFKTDMVTNMNRMFWGCSGLRSLDVTGFKTDNVTSMTSMFYGCRGLTSLDLSGFKTDNVTDMGWMFADCSGLTTIYAGDGWSTANVQYGEDMFTGCTSLVGGAGTKYDASHEDYTYARIDGGSDNPGYFTRKDDGAEGDANGDGTVNAADIVEVVNSIMTNPSDKYNDKAADANGDGVVNAADIVAIVNKIMGL